MTNSIPRRLSDALWRLYNRPNRPVPWAYGGNLPWDNPAFSERMLREHLTENHGAATRISAERTLQLEWMRQKLQLSDADVLDVTCGPGLYAMELARNGCRVTGIDFSPAAIAHGRRLVADSQMENHITFIESDIRRWPFPEADYDTALFLYGQLAVFERREARTLLNQIRGALRPGGCLCIELLDQSRVDKLSSNWWFTDDTGLWGDAPYLLLGERAWYEDEALSMERFYTIFLESGEMHETILCDQTYSRHEMVELLHEAGFHHVDVYPAWDGVSLYDADEWDVYIAHTPI